MIPYGIRASKGTGIVIDGGRFWRRSVAAGISRGIVEQSNFPYVPRESTAYLHHNIQEPSPSHCDHHLQDHFHTAILVIEWLFLVYDASIQLAGINHLSAHQKIVYNLRNDRVSL
ncbi:hypothetical protein FHL15_003473 [Xylaria flabelliformis]|uniref:Uncharacterized protein n=1 Tax=Xylaria flabelliformis TaxID=2512241 RepID=A0A553I5N5_9PEZI|nr:hypothetical protein FHL15_003473 [Xylaria flabelliformis]